MSLINRNSKRKNASDDMEWSLEKKRKKVTSTRWVKTTFPSRSEGTPMVHHLQKNASDAVTGSTSVGWCSVRRKVLVYLNEHVGWSVSLAMSSV